MAKMLKHGEYLQIPLPKNLGFAYGRYLDLTKLFPPPEPPRLPDLVKIFEYRTDSESFDFGLLERSDFLMQPQFVTGLPGTIRKGRWRVLNLKPNTVDTFVPHFRRHEDWVSDSPSENWYYCVDASSQKKFKSTYEDVKHLSELAADGAELIEIRIAMTFLIKDGKNVREYFDLEEYFERSIFDDVSGTPPYYRLPVEIRDRALNYAL
jgi:hypothetical protein